MPARAMPDLDLAHTEAPRGGQDRNETMQFAIDADLTQHLTAIELESTIMIMQPAAGTPAHHPVEHAAGVDLVPGIVQRLLPAADDIKAFHKLRQEPRDLGRVILEIAIKCENQFSPRSLERSRECGCLTKIAPQP